jgi:membrane protein CcdC involved in cytochrome C biogenesis
MTAMNTSVAQLVSTVIVIVFALVVIFIRLRASSQPTSFRKIMIPPLGMSTGFLLFVAPQTHIPYLYALCAVIVGCIFSYPLILSSKMEIRDGAIYLKRSKGFVVIIFVLLALRIVLHNYIEQYVTIPQTGALFFVLAFAMLLPWRLAMLRQYRRLESQIGTTLNDSVQ